MARRNERRIHWAAYLWPGLPHLWISGSWAGLALAVGFALLLNLQLVTTFVWTEWLPPRLKLACSAVLGVIWLVALWETRRELRRLAARRQAVAGAGAEPELPADREGTIHPQADELLRQAQMEYLASNWLAAEQTLLELLGHNRRDIEGQLLLITLWRHCGRLAEAESGLQRLERLEDAAPWAFEIGRERELLADARHKPPAGDEPVAGERAKPRAA